MRDEEIHFSGEDTVNVALHRDAVLQAADEYRSDDTDETDETSDGTTDETSDTSDSGGSTDTSGGNGSVDVDYPNSLVTSVEDHGFPGDRSGGDLATFVASEITEGGTHVFRLPEGTYDWNRGVFMNNGKGKFDVPRPETFVLYGEPQATLHVDIGSDEKFSNRLCFKFGTHRNGVPRPSLKNIHFDVGDANPARDAGIMRCYVSDRGEFENLSITGRKRWTDGSNPSKSGDRFTYQCDVVQEDAVAYHKDIRMPDGDVYNEHAESVGHVIPVASENYHVGTNHWEDLYIAGFIDNGLYLRDGPGSNYVKSTTVKNCAAGCFRLGRNDYAENITVVLDGNQQYNATALWLEEHRESSPYELGSEDDSPLVVDGFEIRATGNPINTVVRISNDPPQTVLKNGYIRVGTGVDDYAISATHDSGSVTIEDVTVDDYSSGYTRIASYRLNGDDITVDNLTHRTHAPKGEYGRSVFEIGGKNITIDNGKLGGTYKPMIEVRKGAEFTLNNCECPHDGTIREPYLIRLIDGSAGKCWLTNNDFEDYASILNEGSLSDFAFTEVSGNHGPS